MADSWPQATELLDVLVKKAKYLDENGMDLYFTHTKGEGNAVVKRRKDGKLVTAPTLPRVDGKNDATKFKEAMKDLDSRPVSGVKTDMSLMLDFLLKKYIMHIRDV